MKYKIPFNRPCLAGNEFAYMSRAMETGHISGGGEYTRKCEEFLERILGAARVLLTTSGTTALEMAALLCRVGEDDEIILPSFTFVSTANAFHLRRSRLVFADIRPDTLNLDENLTAASVTDRTRVIVPVHYGGVGCEMEPILALARQSRVTVVEDAAQAIGASYSGRPLGTFGQLAAVSFHETKNISCGEGGALIINDSEFKERAEILREKGTNRSKFFRGEVDKYTWLDVGSSFLPSDLLAAYLLAQLEKLDAITHRRRLIFETYRRELSHLERRGECRLPVIPKSCAVNYHVFYLLLDSEKTRNSLIEFLKQRGILAVFHYVPLHLSPVGRSLNYRPGQFPVTESVSSRLVRLPFYNDLNEQDQLLVIQAVRDFFDGT